MEIMEKRRRPKNAQLCFRHRFVAVSDWQKIIYFCQKCGFEMALLSPLDGSSGRLEREVSNVLRGPSPKRGVRRYKRGNRKSMLAKARYCKAGAS